ncbi:uncharacterized protein LOC111674156 [Orussus abietinus]|uniref:uncharacterized protein LOC111674156 n=1 Tax=Orussus abietinus TaxID=222816 RepID=UPI000C716181|nr:uncharacterized protein LOC111674156 [Orussus abietinus]
MGVALTTFRGIEKNNIYLVDLGGKAENSKASLSHCPKRIGKLWKSKITRAIGQNGWGGSVVLVMRRRSLETEYRAPTEPPRIVPWS